MKRIRLCALHAKLTPEIVDSVDGELGCAVCGNPVAPYEKDAFVLHCYYDDKMRAVVVVEPKGKARLARQAA